MDPKDILTSEETLFRNAEAFNPDYVPDQFSFRDAQLKEMMFCLRPVIRGGKASNAFMIGQPATGKTTAVRLVFEQLMETTSSVIPAYVNCRIESSAFKIISEIRRAVLGMPAPDTGIPITRVRDEVFSRLKRDGKHLVVCLDDVNYLFSSGIADEVLYSILRAHEAFPGVKTCVFAISTEEVLHKLDGSVRSTFSPVRIEFPPYSTSEITEILSRRREYGLYPNVLSDQLLGEIASRTRDLRWGIELLKQSALAAESDASKKIKQAHMERALKSLSPPEASDDKMMMLEILRERGPLESGRLFSEIKERREVSYASFYRMLRRLEAGGFIEIESRQAASGRGRTSTIRAR